MIRTWIKKKEHWFDLEELYVTILGLTKFYMDGKTNSFAEFETKNESLKIEASL